MDYVLANDDCECCNYVSTALTLLSLPYQKVILSEINSRICKTARAMIVCKNNLAKLKKVFENIEASSLCPLILLIESNHYKKEVDTPTFFLKIPFTQFEFKNVLANLNGLKEHDLGTEMLNCPGFEKLLGPSSHIKKVKELIKQVSQSDTTVLILGESGTGKDVIASSIHYLSSRKESPFVPINCGAIPAELMESELFGHEKGAFTGASARRAGRFEIAHTGSLFMDEIGDMPLPMQVKLLRVIQDKKIERVGGAASIDVDVRLIAATNKNLSALIADHQFREDLYYRINVFPIQVPSLRERSEDIPMLIDYHLDKIYARLKHRISFTESAKGILAEYAWPGNIRELQNFLERMTILYPDHIVDEKMLDAQYLQKKPLPVQSLQISADESFNIKEYITNIERQVIQLALEQTNGKLAVAAKLLSLGKTTLLEKVKKYNLIPQE